MWSRVKFLHARVGGFEGMLLAGFDIGCLRPGERIRVGIAVGRTKRIQGKSSFI